MWYQLPAHCHPLPYRFGRYKCEKGTTAVLTEKVSLLEFDVVDETVQTMDTS